MEIDLWCQAEVYPVNQDGSRICPRPNCRAVCFENASKEAAQAESIFDNNRVLQEEPAIFMA